jgi:dTDP-4-amino-4,6-dideoxygalactose transaminase
MALGLKPGDEVITPSFTYIATVETVALLGITPVFCEVDPKTFTMNPEAIEQLITPKTKAIVPVHLYGQSAAMEPLLALAKKHNLYVIEDNAQAIGGHYTFSDGTKKANGTMGHIGTTSFFPSKNLGAYGDGGALFTNDSELAEKLKMVANHGQKKKYVHDVVGCNSRLDTLQAAILRIKLKHLDAYCDARRAVAATYDAAFANHPKIETPYCAPNAHHVYHQYNLILKDVSRDEIKEKLQAAGIPTMIYYPIPAHKQQVFQLLGLPEYQLEITDWLTDRVLALPIHTEMDAETQQYIIDTLLNLLK